MSCPRLLLTCGIVFLCLRGGVAWAMRLSPGETFPKPVEIEIGGEANITCHMNLERFEGSDSASIYFEEADTNRRVPSSSVVVLNKTSAVFMLRNALPQNRDYHCKSGTDGIDITHVSVGTKPLDVIDFKCHAYDYRFMVCNFTIPRNNISTRYELCYRAKSPNYIQNCQIEVQNWTGVCNLTRDHSDYNPHYDFYDFTLTGNNSLGVNKQHFRIDHLQSVVPPKPELRIKSVTTNSAVLSWDLMTFSFYKSNRLQYEVRVRPDDHDWMTYQLDADYKVYNNGSKYYAILWNLPYAYYNYTVRVRQRVEVARDDDTMWSEPGIKRVQTKAKRPDAPPKTDAGSFYIDPTETQVRLFWEQLPRTLENGPHFQYVVTQVRQNGKEINVAPLQIDRISAIFPWNKAHSYEFSIKSRNAEGYSREYSRIYVPAMSAKTLDTYAPKWISNVYNATKRTQTLSWNPPDTVTNCTHNCLVAYTVFWCKSKHVAPTECSDTIRFKHLARNATQFTTEPQEQEQTLNLAISANYEHFSTGMYRTMCMANVADDLIKLEPKNTTITAHSIKVQWSLGYMCPSVLEGYNLTYCEVLKPSVDASTNTTTMVAECLTKPLTERIPKEAKNFVLDELRPYTNYKIVMLMYSKLKVGNLSDAIFIETDQDAPTPPRHLRSANVTSNSVWISWSPPTALNGIISGYDIFINDVRRKIYCQEVSCPNDSAMQMSYELKQLSSYTDYHVYVVARTIKESAPSNTIQFKTLIGIPSKPSRMEFNGNNHSIIQWFPPEMPSGRVEMYEVEVTVWHRDQIQRQRISTVIGAMRCMVNIPVCRDSDYKHTLRVRAVNGALRSTELDYKLFAPNLTSLSEENFVDLDAIYYEDNEDLKCEVSAATISMEKREELLARYRDRSVYILFKSPWEQGPIYGCAATADFTRRAAMDLVLALMVLLCMAVVLYYGYAKCKRMSNISCKIPAGLEIYAKRGVGGSGGFLGSNGLVKEEDDSCRKCDLPFTSNENRRLLSSSSSCNDSGYIGGSGTGKSSSGECSEPSEEILVEKGPPGNGCDAAYMTMKILQSHEGEMEPTPVLASDGYVQPTEAFLKQQLEPRNLPTYPSNCYIKPTNKMFDWQQPTTDLGIATDAESLSFVGNGYVQPDMLTKMQSPVQPAFSGYTTLEALGKPSITDISAMLDTPTGASNGSDVGGALPPISGYVTQKELSAFGHQRLS